MANDITFRIKNDDLWHIMIIISIWIGIIITVVAEHSFMDDLSPSLSTTTSIPSTITSTTYAVPVFQNCKIRQGTFYYLSTCPHCQQELSEHGIDALRNDGVSVTMIEVTTGNYSNIQYVPTWYVNGNYTVGYQTIDQIKGLFGCQ